MIRKQCRCLAVALALGAGPCAAGWIDTRAEIEALTRDGRFGEAEARYERLLDEVGEELGEPSSKLAETHLYLAALDLDRGEFLQAESRIIAAIETYRQAESPNTPALIEPFRLLGEVRYADGNYDPALAAFDEARQQVRRHYGLLDQDQLGIMAQMVQTALRKGDLDLAKDLQDEVLTLVGRYHGTDSIEYVEATLEHVVWLRRVGEIKQAARISNLLQDVLDDIPDDQPLLKISALRLVSERQRRQQPFELREALRVAEGMDERDEMLQVSILLDIVNWYLEMRQPYRIQKYYLQAWDLLDETEEGRELRARLLGEPQIVRMSPLIPPRHLSGVITDAQNAALGSVDLEFDVDPDGRARGIRVVTSNPTGLLDSAAILAIGNFQFRPAMRDREIVTAAGRFQWQFNYDPAALP